MEGLKMPAILNVGDFVKTAIIAFLFIWIANRVLAKIGMESFQA